MKITSVEAIPCRVPRTATFTSSLGATSFSENAVVLIHTDDDITGLGEACSVWDRMGRGESDYINDLLAEALIGCDPFCINEIIAIMDGLLHRALPAKSGIEMALFDIVGKALNTPVYNLLGGKVRDRLMLSHSLSMGAPDRIADQAEKLAEHGYGTLKTKVGRDRKADIATLQAVRRRLPDITLRADANMGWTNAKEAVARIKELESFNLELVEQPLHFSDMPGMGLVRETVDTPIMADESVWTPFDAMACVRAGAADIFNVYVSEAGGLTAATRIFAIAQAAHLPCIIGSMPEFGIGTAAQAHLAFAMDNIGYACDVNGVVYHRDDILHTELRIENGYVYPPTGPGLGVELDPERLERYRIKD